MVFSKVDGLCPTCTVPFTAIVPPVVRNIVQLDAVHFDLSKAIDVIDPKTL